jgi:hypothetical protein
MLISPLAVIIAAKFAVTECARPIVAPVVINGSIVMTRPSRKMVRSRG